MKKESKRKSFTPPEEGRMREVQPDITELMLKVQQQLSFLEKKIDTLIGQSQSTPFRAEPQKSFQRFDHPRHQGERRPDSNFRDRVLHKAICAECNKECEVPFKPSQDRPVYCKDCFSKRKGAGPFQGNSDRGPREDRPFHERGSERPHRGGKKKFFEKKFFDKKRAPGKKRKSRD